MYGCIVIMEIVELKSVIYTFDHNFYLDALL